MIPALDPEAVARIVRAALAEDLGSAGDLTTEAIVAAKRRARARLVARAPLVVAGLPVAEAVFTTVDATLRFAARAAEGEAVAAGAVLADLWGHARPILVAERTALNFLGRMCGIATAARRAVEEVAGTGALVLDTRKTAPGLRVLDKYAVAAGGAVNHRMGLHDAAMIKDTHRPVALPVAAAVAQLLARGVARERITVEVGTLAELDEAIAAGAGRALLDNMDPEALRLCVARAAGRIELEASGGLRPGTLRAVAETGVGRLSVGWLTHSAPAADLALDLVAEGG
jgi:nicotinate-nucleotide pyrophosphorylase (carboxylating)